MSLNDEGTPHLAKLMPADLRRCMDLIFDLTYYRTVEDDGGLGHAAWIEFRAALNALPEAKQ